MGRIVLGIFADAIAASEAIEGLRKNGIAWEAVSVLMSESTWAREFENKGGGEGNVNGAVKRDSGAVLKAIGERKLTLGPLPGQGMGMIVAGPFVAALVGANGGNLAEEDGLTHVLLRLNIDEDEARLVSQHVQNGNILIGVNAADGDQADMIEDILDR